MILMCYQSFMETNFIQLKSYEALSVFCYFLVSIFISIFIVQFEHDQTIV